MDLSNSPLHSSFAYVQTTMHCVTRAVGDYRLAATTVTPTLRITDSSVADTAAFFKVSFALLSERPMLWNSSNSSCCLDSMMTSYKYPDHTNPVYYMYPDPYTTNERRCVWRQIHLLTVLRMRVCKMTSLYVIFLYKRAIFQRREKAIMEVMLLLPLLCPLSAVFAVFAVFFG